MEQKVVKEVYEYLDELQKQLSGSFATLIDLYSIKTEYTIQIGSYKCRADVVLLKTDTLPTTEPQISEPMVRMPDGTEVLAKNYVAAQLQEKSRRINSEWDRVRAALQGTVAAAPATPSWQLSTDEDTYQEYLPFWEIQTNRLIVIAECKAVGKRGNGIEQLKAYLAATDTRFGIFAASLDPDEWKYYENLGQNKFETIDSRADFEKEVNHYQNTEADKEEAAKNQIKRAITHHRKRVEQELNKKYALKEQQLARK